MEFDSVNIHSNHTEEELDNAFSYPEPLRIVLITLGVTYTVIGLPGNLLTVIAIVRLKSLRTRLNCFIVNLCITDITAVGYLYPLVTFDLIFDYHPVPLLWCQLNKNLLHLLAGATFITVQAIAISRYAKVCHPAKFERIFSKTNTVVLCFLSWVPGCLIAAYTIPNLSDIKYIKVARICLVGVKEFSVPKAVFIGLLPLSYMCTTYSYFRVWQTLRKNELSLRSRGNEAFSRIKHESNRRHTSMSFLVSLFYICLTFPMLFVFTVGIHFPKDLYGIVLSLYFSNSLINCIVYGAMHKGIRRFYQNVLPGLRQIRVQPSSDS